MGHFLKCPIYCFFQTMKINQMKITGFAKMFQSIEFKRLTIKFLAIVFAIFACASLIFSMLNFTNRFIFNLINLPNNIISILGGILVLITTIIAFGLWNFKSWAKSIIFSFAGLAIIYFLIRAIFNFSSIVFGGKEITPLITIAITFIQLLLVDLLKKSLIPVSLILILKFQDEGYLETQTQRNFVNQMVKYILLFAASSSLLIVALIFIFTFMESTDAIVEIGLGEMLLGTIWRPGSIIGNDSSQFGLVPMIIGSIYSTIGAVIIGVPLSIGTAILLAEIAPPFFRNIFRPAIELLAGIPSVIYGLFGMIVLAPLIRNFEISGNSGFGLLNASIILAIMILPTITNITEDAIKAVPQSYRFASLALGATKWQTIRHVILPAARSGIIAAIILGIGRALGETMALIMVIGNSIAIPKPLNNNPFTLLLATARTLTGNIAVEINYAAGVHRSALFFTGVLLFILLLFINRIAHFLMKEKKWNKE